MRADTLARPEQIHPPSESSNVTTSVVYVTLQHVNELLAAIEKSAAQFDTGRAFLLAQIGQEIVGALINDIDLNAQSTAGCKCDGGCP
ncbi:hypothetical protein [Caballeronia sp. LZ001]|uniref:hypothetical protein n=1 Tax=Caballeronia sp. LZ001 TaxID=3038553 RepID=UPI002856B5CB|nr:hypothetical protein [Caballeronia sp. LZ001]MDR5800593.1 hypothetical protein [Caballeronia sp. LZ001]